MRKRLIVVLLGAMVLMLSFTVAYARGHNADQLQRWDCFNAGPSNWLHCSAPGAGSEKTIQIKVFGEEGDPFLGTELLVHVDQYHGQPCPQDNHDDYEKVPEIPYMACHHFETGH